MVRKATLARNDDPPGTVRRALADLPAATTEAVVALLDRHDVDLDRFEASIRCRFCMRCAAWKDCLSASQVCGDEPGIRGGRMMIQRATVDLVTDLDDALSLGHRSKIEAIARAAEAESLSLITGWELRQGEIALKIYVNASHAGERVRSRMAARLGLSRLLAGRVPPPHIIGFNLTSTGFETKVYRQSNESRTVGSLLGHEANSLAERFADVSVGSVVSWGLGPRGFEPRAFFIAPATDWQDHARTLCDGLPGWSRTSVEAALPYVPGELRSIGVSLKSPGWTAYFRPVVQGVEHKALLSPSVCLGSGRTEIGLYVDTSVGERPAAARTAQHVISYVVRSGVVPGPAVDDVLRWAVERVESAERHDIPLDTVWRDPLHPWVIVED